LIKTLINEKTEELALYRSTQKDRIYHIWERRPKWIEVMNVPIFNQKLDYIHANPIQERWNLVTNYEDYKWSTASYYGDGEKRFEFVTEL